MLRTIYITRFFAGVLLMVFALSITPKRFLHNVFAKHIDSKSKQTPEKPYQLITSGYNCDSDNLVAESSFVSVQHFFEFPLVFSFSSYILKNISFSSTPKTFSPLRGPPVNI